MVQHATIKIFAHDEVEARLGDARDVFHRWIQRRDLDGTWIDVADYTHVTRGPGVLLIGQEADYSFNDSQGRLGLAYNRKAVGDGGLRQAYESALEGCRRLEREPEFEGKLAFDAGDVELTLNDRLLHPNTEEGWRAIEPEVACYFREVLGECMIERAGEPRERLRIRVRRRV